MIPVFAVAKQADSAVICISHQRAASVGLQIMHGVLGHRLARTAQGLRYRDVVLRTKDYNRQHQLQHQAMIGWGKFPVRPIRKNLYLHLPIQFF